MIMCELSGNVIPSKVAQDLTMLHVHAGTLPSITTMAPLDQPCY